MSGERGGAWGTTWCEDCFTCTECERKVCEVRPYCEHQVTCDSCYPAGCEDCLEQLEAEGAL